MGTGRVNRKKPTKRQIIERWEAGQGRCWRCEEKIVGKPTPVYGEDWVLGHVGKPHWLGGIKTAPEHTKCNSDDGKEQTKLAAKSVRIRAKAIGIKPKRKGFWGWRKFDGTLVWSDDK
jgi:hypothetical protein